MSLPGDNNLYAARIIPAGQLRRLLPFLRPYIRIIMIGPLLMVGEVTMDLLQPRLMETIVDKGIANLDMALVLRTGMLMVGLAFAGAACGMLNTVLVVPMTQGFGAGLRAAVYRKVHSLSIRNIDTLGTGNLVTRLTNDVTQVQDALLALMRICIRAPLIFLGSIILAALTCPSLSIILLVQMPFLMLIVAFFYARSRGLFGGVQDRLDKLNSVMQENIAGIRVVKAFVRADYEESRFGAANIDLTAQTARAMRFMAGVMPLMVLAVDSAIAAAIWYGGKAVVGGTMQVGQVIAFSNYLLRMLMALTLLAMLLVRLSRAAASAGRIVQVLDTEPDVRDLPGSKTAFPARGRVVFDHVTFRYPGAQDPALRDVSFTAEPGQTVAVLGATGSGKSTLVHLLPRFYNVDSGRVLLDDTDVRDLTQEALRRQIGFVLQESVLFTGTIRDNIRYGRPDATDAEVVAAARLAQAHDFIAGFTDGYDTQLGQRGVNLSGGQRQRIAIARALLLRPPILVFDDSTSAVDVETESRIETALRETMSHSTSIVIAQRISTVLNADKILVLDGGRLIAQGKHRQLLAESDVYREIYESQLGGDPRTGAPKKESE